MERSLPRRWRFCAWRGYFSALATALLAACSTAGLQSQTVFVPTSSGGVEAATVFTGITNEDSSSSDMGVGRIERQPENAQITLDEGSELARRSSPAFRHRRMASVNLREADLPSNWLCRMMPEVVQATTVHPISRCNSSAYVVFYDGRSFIVHDLILESEDSENENIHSPFNIIDPIINDLYEVEDLLVEGEMVVNFVSLSGRLVRIIESFNRKES